jgi:hypothetical protein
MRLRWLILAALLFANCGNDHQSYFTGKWAVRQDSVQTLTDTCACAADLVQQLPPFDIGDFQESNKLPISLCNEPDCVGVVGSFKGIVGKNDDAMKATGALSGLSCAPGVDFTSDDANLDTAKVTHDVAILTFEARGLAGNRPCRMEFSGSLDRT